MKPLIIIFLSAYINHFWTMEQCNTLTDIDHLEFLFYFIIFLFLFYGVFNKTVSIN